MGIVRRILRNALPIGILVLSATFARAQDPEMLRHFDYDRKAPLEIKHVGIQRRGRATVYDLTYASPKGGVVPAYLVVPKGRGPFAAVIWTLSLRAFRIFINRLIRIRATDRIYMINRIREELFFSLHLVILLILSINFAN